MLCHFKVNEDGYTHIELRTHADNLNTIVSQPLRGATNNEAGVYCTLLDARRAFDRVNYINMFDILLDINVCPLNIRSLIVTNGVKQGGVLSPILFIMYIDELLVRLFMSKSGCHINSYVLWCSWVCGRCCVAFA